MPIPLSDVVELSESQTVDLVVHLVPVENAGEHVHRTEAS